MKKTIKKLSAILAILVLSMTIAVPVTAVEYEIDPCAEFGYNQLYSNTLYYYSESAECLAGVMEVRVGHNDSTNVLSASTSASTRPGYEVDHTIEAYVDGCIYTISPSHSVPFSEYGICRQWWDFAEAYATVDLPNSIDRICTTHGMGWDGTVVLDDYFECAL